MAKRGANARTTRANFQPNIKANIKLTTDPEE
jgi:hypothetical protein